MAAGASGRVGTAPRASWRAGMAQAALAIAGAVGRQWRLAAGLPETWRGLRCSWGAEGDVVCWLRSATGQSECGARRGCPVAARAKRALWARLEHARDVLDRMLRHVRGL